MSKHLEGKIALVTGGISGIGAAIVSHFLDEGAIVYVLDKNVPDSIVSDTNEHLTVFPGDVTSNEDVKSFISNIQKTASKIDILINNAGIIRDNVIWKMDEEDFDAVIDVNLKGPWLMCREVAPIMRAQNSGRIVNIASRSWLGSAGQSNYSASKGGLVSMTRVLALELGKNNITVNAVAPGLIDTPMTRSLDPEVYNMLEKSIPCKKAGKPADIAHTVAFLSSDEASFINGQVIHVDGGKSIGANVH
ncbi:MAG: SDR family NAD(P)-dependent oxidoreductase [Candidatus Marinimicrobia bacterium]|jgi:NAD(P)-dependent dehydrogenase (short-subunit alcohol dehydrogenase family)|nr:SDR family NAD(P)-dependent oxidoreductase [Candidatus Neomarinimicrobiota bacterium]|tara:strand:- start:1191 stop:1934 length:744 start_codon:yes stop_codon:yes gene_type:complete